MIVHLVMVRSAFSRSAYPMFAYTDYEKAQTKAEEFGEDAEWVPGAEVITLAVDIDKE